MTGKYARFARCRIISIWKELRKKLLAQMVEKVGQEHYGEERRASQLEKAERVINEEMRASRWKEAMIDERKKGKLENLKIAVHLRELLVTTKWICDRLQMGSVTYSPVLWVVMLLGARD